MFVFFQFAVLGKYDFWLVEEYADGVGGGAGQGPFWGRYGAAYLMKRFDALFGFGAFRSFRVENPRRTTDFHF